MKRFYFNCKLIILFGAFAFSNCKAQETSIGISAGLNNTFFHKGKSVYDARFFRPLMDQGISLAVPVCIDLVPRWSVRSGIGYAYKQFTFMQDSFAQPGINGVVSDHYRVHALEIPLIIGFKRDLSGRRFLFEYQAGVVAAFNMATKGSMTYRSDNPEQDSLISLSTLSFYKPSGPRFSTDLYAAVSLIRFAEGSRRHQFSLSYQYGLQPVLDRDNTNLVSVGSGTYSYRASLKPTLSYLALTYTFFPAWLQWGSPDPPEK